MRIEVEKGVIIEMLRLRKSVSSVKEVIAIDGCVARSGRINCVVLED